jgi:hypothetical protein
MRDAGLGQLPMAHENGMVVDGTVFQQPGTGELQLLEVLDGPCTQRTFHFLTNVLAELVGLPCPLSPTFDVSKRHPNTP